MKGFLGAFEKAKLLRLWVIIVLILVVCLSACLEIGQAHSALSEITVDDQGFIHIRIHLVTTPGDLHHYYGYYGVYADGQLIADGVDCLDNDPSNNTPDTLDKVLDRKICSFPHGTVLRLNVVLRHFDVPGDATVAHSTVMVVKQEYEPPRVVFMGWYERRVLSDGTAIFIFPGTKVIIPSPNRFWGDYIYHPSVDTKVVR